MRPARPNLAGLLPLSAALDWLVLAGVGVALVLWRPVPALVIGLVVLDLVRFGMGQNPAIPIAHAKQPATAAIRFLQARDPARFAGLVPDFGITPLPADVAMRYGLQDARGYDYPVVDRYDKLWRRAVAPNLPFIPPTTLATTTPTSLRALGLLGVRSLVGQPGDRKLPLPVAYDGPDARIYDNPRALPRAWVAADTAPHSGPAAGNPRARLRPAPHGGHRGRDERRRAAAAAPRSPTTRTAT